VLRIGRYRLLRAVVRLVAVVSRLALDETMTPRTVLILCERAPVKVNPVPAVRYVKTIEPREYVWECSWCGRRVQVVS
jgi:hypothetical protein